MPWATLIIALLLCGGWPGLAPAANPPPANQSPPPPPVGIVEHLGQHLPGDVVLNDEQGRPVNLRQLITLPTILVPVYYACPTACNLLLGRLSQVLPQVRLQPGRDFQVVAVSFDERETPRLARQKHLDFTTAMAGGFPPQHWHFLTGDLANIMRLMDAIGFHFQRQGDMFRHPMALVAVSPSGKITRYLYGDNPLPFDLTMAATEAAGEKTGLSITRALALCYSYDPQGRRYVFNLMGMAGLAVLAGILLFVVFLVVGARKRRQRQAQTGARGEP